MIFASVIATTSDTNAHSDRNMARMSPRISPSSLASRAIVSFSCTYFLAFLDAAVRTAEIRPRTRLSRLDSAPAKRSRTQRREIRTTKKLTICPDAKEEGGNPGGHLAMFRSVGVGVGGGAITEQRSSRSRISLQQVPLRLKRAISVTRLKGVPGQFDIFKLCRYRPIERVAI